MIADRTRHLHTEECNFLADILDRCKENGTPGMPFGSCNYWQEAAFQCYMQEQKWRRKNNTPMLGMRQPLMKLPEAYYTPALKKLRNAGVLDLNKVHEQK